MEEPDGFSMAIFLFSPFFFLFQFNLLVNGIVSGAADGFLITGRGDSGDFFKLFGKIMDGRIAKGFCGIGQVHFIFPDKLFGSAYAHLTEIFDGAESGMFPENPLEMSASDGKLMADVLNADFLGNMGSIVIGDTVKKDGISF